MSLLCPTNVTESALSTPPRELRTKTGQFHQSSESFNLIALSCFLNTSLSDGCRPAAGRRMACRQLSLCPIIESLSCHLRPRDNTILRGLQNVPILICKSQASCISGRFAQASDTLLQDEQPTPNSRKQQNAHSCPKVFGEMNSNEK